LSAETKLTVAGALAAVLSIPCVAAAQINTLVPSVTLDFRYDSNARFTNDKTASDNGDFIASASPSFEFTRHGRQHDVSAFYSLTADHHTSNTELNNISHSAGLDLSADLTGRWRFGLGDRANYTEDSLRGVGFGEGVLVTRTDMLTNTAYVSLGRAASRNTDVTLTLKDYVQKFDDPALVDSRTDSAGLTGRYIYTRTGTALLSYAYTNFRFDTNGQTDIDTHGVSVGVEEAVGRSVKVNLGGGVEYADGLNGDGDLFYTANAGIEKTFRDSVMNLSFERDISTPTGLADEISIKDVVTFIWDFNVKRNVFASFYAGIAKHKTEPEGRVDINSYIAEVSGNWQPYRWLLLGAGASHYQQWPEDDFGVGLTRNKIFVNMTLIGPEWRF